MKKTQENIVTQIEENEKKLSNLREKLFGWDDPNHIGVLTEMNMKLDDIQSDMNDIASEFRYLYYKH